MSNAPYTEQTWQQQLYIEAQGGSEEAIIALETLDTTTNPNTRFCSCCSGLAWVDCPEQSQYCG